MADKRISQLNSHTTPSGSDFLVIVNNNETKKITYADLTATITGSQTDLTPLNQFTQSFNSFSASVHTEILAGTNEQDLSNLVTNVTLGVLSGSVDGRLDNLEANTGSYLTNLNGAISSSSQLTSSYDSRYVLSGSITQTTWDNISGKPDGLVSQSVDIADFVFTTDTITNSDVTIHATDGDIVLNADGNVYKGSASAGNGLVTDGYLGVIIGDESRINTGTGHSITDNLDNIINSIPSISSLNSFTSSYFTDSASIDSRVLTEKGRIDAILSASTANADTFAEIVTLINSVDTTNDNAFATYYTSSNARISSLENNTGSYETKGRGIVSSSAQISSYGFVSGSYETTGRGIISSSAQLPSGLISGSSQLTASYDSRYVLSGSITQTTWDNIANKPSGIVSGSSQLTSSYDTRYAPSASYLTSLNGAFSSSIQTLGGSGVWSGSAQLPSGLVSGSSQISTWGYTTTSSFNSFTASYTTDSASFDSSINAIMALSASTMMSDIIHNGESFTIQKGTPLYVSGSQGSNPIVYVADASNPNKMPVTYIAGGNITTNSNGTGILLGHIEGIDLTGYAEGTSVYVAEGGGWSINPPSGSSSIKQFLGLVTKTGNGGKGMVLNPGPATLPNLKTGYIWVGNTNNQASTMMTASFVFTSSYNSDSSSFDSRISALVSSGVPAGTVSGSSQLTASYDTRYTLSGSVQSVTLPSGLVSGSSQLTSSYDTRYALSASYLTSLNGAISSSSQVLGGSGIYSSSAQLPTGIVSGSAQITAFGFISQSTDLTSLNSFTASYTTDSSSFNSRIVSLTNNTSSYETTGRGIISQSVVTISGTAPSVNTGNLWYDSNIGNLYLRYDSNTWVDTSNGVIQTIINDGSLLSTASFNAWTASYTASVPAGTVSGSSQLTSSLDTRYELQGRGIISSSTQISGLGYATTGSNTFIGNEIISGTLNVSSSFTASLQTGYTWVGNGNNISTAFPTSSLLSTASFNSWTGSTFNTLSSSVATVQTNLNQVTASLGATSTAFNYTNVVNPTNFVLVQYLTSSFNGGVIDALAVNNANSTATSTAYQFANYGNNVGISQNGKQTSGAGAPNLAPSISVSGSYVLLTVTLTGTFNIKGVARLF